MSKSVIDDLTEMLKNMKEINEECKKNKKLKILFESEMEHQKSGLTEMYNNEFRDVKDIDMCKTYCKQLLIQMGIPETDLE